MAELRETAYLQQVLALDPRADAALLVLRRREYLRPAAIIAAEFADDCGNNDDIRAQTLKRLNSVRRAFWRLGDDELVRQLSMLEHVPFADVAVAATRLQEVGRQRKAFQRFAAEPDIHPAFTKALCEILIAPVGEANRLREREHRSMRPEQTEHYASARWAVQQTAHVIRTRYPELFALEEAWLTELLEYNPIDETKHESANTLFGLAVLGVLGVTLLLIVGIVSWIFS
jgi:hypothetical protein